MVEKKLNYLRNKNDNRSNRYRKKMIIKINYDTLITYS